MKIIDFDRKGNVVRFYLGEKTKDWGWTNKDFKDSSGNTPKWLKPSETFYGDDWDDVPYESNAGTVYEEFIKGTIDKAYDFDDLVLEPGDSYTTNSIWSKEDMAKRSVPCLIIVPKSLRNGREYGDEIFTKWLGAEGVKKIYLGDDESVLKE